MRFPPFGLAVAIFIGAQTFANAINDCDLCFVIIVFYTYSFTSSWLLSKSTSLPKQFYPKRFFGAESCCLSFNILAREVRLKVLLRVMIIVRTAYFGKCAAVVFND